MIKLTKKEFKALHDNNKLSLIGSFKYRKEFLLIELSTLDIDKIEVKKTSRIDIDNIKDYSVINVYQDNKFVFVENSITDKIYGNSIYTVCYLIK